MKRSLYIYNDGILQRHDNTIRFITENNDKKDIPIETISEINIMSQMNFNTSLINLLAQQGIMVHFFNYYDFYIGSFCPREKLLSGQLLVKQVNAYTNQQERILIARKFVEGASANIFRNLRYYNERG